MRVTKKYKDRIRAKLIKGGVEILSFEKRGDELLLHLRDSKQNIGFGKVYLKFFPDFIYLERF